MSLLTPTHQVCSWTQALDDPASLATYVANGGYQALAPRRHRKGVG